MRENVRHCTSRITHIFLDDFKWDLYPHSPYSPNLTPSDYYLFAAAYEYFADQQFPNIETVKNVACDYFQNLDMEYCHRDLEKLLKMS